MFPKPNNHLTNSIQQRKRGPVHLPFPNGCQRGNGCAGIPTNASLVSRMAGQPTNESGKKQRGFAFAKGFHANMVCQVKIYCVEYFYLRFHHPLLGIGIWISQIWYGTAKCHEVQLVCQLHLQDLKTRTYTCLELPYFDQPQCMST